MRGQAFVSFADPQIAKKAMKEVKGFPLYSKPMVCCLHFFIKNSNLLTDRVCWAYYIANIVCEVTIGRSGEEAGCGKPG
jgi:hypothetical protein